MSDIEWLIDDVENSPWGPRVGAFFAFDGTLISGYSAAAFFEQRLEHGEIPLKDLLHTTVERVAVERRIHDVSELMRIGIEAQAGQSYEEFEGWSRKVFAKRISGMVFPEARTLVDAHLRMGHTVVIASSATTLQIGPTAEDLGINHLVCTQIEVNDEGVVTGRLDGELCWGPVKVDALKRFSTDHDVDLSRSFAYSNGSEDLPMLESVGRPRAVNPDADLAKVARKRRWGIAHLKLPPKTTPITIARSAAAAGVFAAGVVTGAAMAVLNRNRTVGANVAATVGSDLTLATAGVELRVVGEKNAWSHRPAVFIFNHQSQLDVFVLGSVLRRDFTGVAKKSLEHDPLFAPVGYLADVAYIDRANTAKAVEALRPVVEALKGGRSIAIAPEGTRSPTPRLLPFKKGAFHVAMQANVPIVPVVMRNCGELMRAHSYVVHPGTVDVAVLQPIFTKGWNKENLDSKIAEVRGMFLKTLANWPTR
ncbi:MAG: HAD-IB family hydrolase [Candidatus Nanopelagicales bacterium]|nr:HAD-IB family hydrolase [Candidatus Nanopelagicales bacterium]MDZ4249404.1 HAD-IB family hydrolase [Candidatus Nanopelagicales bacterium]